MGMKKGETIDKWIDLSNLPRNKRGYIDWKNTINFSVEFKYGDIIGELKIIKYNIKESVVTIYIDKYTDIIGKEIKINHLSRCKLGRILSKPISITHPDLVQYFYNKEDANIYTFGSNKKVQMVCPHCRATKYQSPNQLTMQGFSCSACSDGISYPNKLIFNMLRQLNIPFQNEINKATPGFGWIQDRCRYDFYIEHGGNKYFIEADGGWHRYQDVKNRDNTKDVMANEHNIEVIRIDCNYKATSTRHNIIKNNILNSKLSNIFDLSCVDWELCEKYANTNLINVACDYWNNGITSVLQISRLMNMSRNTIASYLKIGANIGICDYALKKSRSHRSISM